LLPTALWDDLENNYRFLEQNRLLDHLERTANLLCHRQIVLMGTLGYREFMRQGRLIPNGPLGFQGDVAYQDFRVRWMSELVPHACLSVLRQISRADSPLYWKTCEDEKLCTGVNHYLVELFQRLLKQASREKRLPPVGQMKQEIEKEILLMTDFVSKNSGEK
jgi:anaerobic magnesium-protoporphyrin IX monomethyl ester cyclase